jgi:hypothetical protein
MGHRAVPSVFAKRIDMILRSCAAQHQAGFIHSYTNKYPGQAAGLHEEKAQTASLTVVGTLSMRVRHHSELMQVAAARLAGVGRRRHDPASTAATNGEKT